MHNIKRIIKVMTISSIICFVIATPTFASSKNTNNISLSIERYEPKEGWKPGDNNEIKITIKNNSNKNIKVDQIFINHKSKEGLNLEKAFKEMSENTNVIFRYNNKNISKDITLQNLLSDGKVVIDDVVVNRNTTLDILMAIDMNENMGNNAQGLSNVYTFKIGYRNIDNGGGGTVTPPIKPEEPEKPVDPENPDQKPEEPDKPENPDQKPDEPENPDKPENPDQKPDEPNNPENPENPDKPSNPGGNPNKPDKPNKPGSGNNNTNVGGSTDKLPQTGGFVNSTTLTILGLSVAGAGIVLDRKSSSKKGGKIDE
ncbi:MAG: hypothetical protein RSB41_03745 [Bacilli bacterium]